MIEHLKCLCAGLAAIAAIAVLGALLAWVLHLGGFAVFFAVLLLAWAYLLGKELRWKYRRDAP